MIRTSRAHLHVAAVTHPGMGGRQNEDRYSVSSFQLGEEHPTPSLFAIVSDGIGGHSAGEIAAEMAVETISHMIAQSDASRPLEILDHAIQVTSDAIAFKAHDNSQRLGMGTTCACAWVIGSQLFIASVGDSRIYLMRAGSLQQLTTDHTWVQEAVEKGILDPQQARSHPNVHVIRRYLGSNKTPHADVRLRLASEETDTQARSNQGMRLLPGDVLLLCSDGLTDVVNDDDIAQTIRGRDLQPAAQALVELACQRTGQDNITAILLLVPWTPAPARRASRFWIYLLWGVIALVFMALLIALGSWLVFGVWLPPSATPTPPV
jgi:protein phosphatase